MKKITFLILTLLFTALSWQTQAQCLTAPFGAYGTMSPSCATGAVASVGFAYTGEYSTVNVTAGNQYEFTSSVATHYLTVSNNTGTTALVFGASPLLWTSTVTGQVRFYTHLSSACNSSTASHTRSVRCVLPPPANNLCVNAFVLTEDGTTPGTTIGATNSGTALCGTSSTSGDVWYTFTDESGMGSTVTVNTCAATGFDTKLTVFRGSCGALICVDGNDDFCGARSQVTFTTDGSSTYYIMVHGFSAATGNFDLTLSGFPTGVVGSPPQIICPNDIVINNTTGTCGAQVFFNNATAIDPEDGLIPVTQTMGPGTGSIFPIGDTIIEFSATDSDGNTSTCQFTITVVDVDDPIAVCQDITVELDETGTVTIFAEDLNFGAGTPEPVTPISCGVNPGPTSTADTNLVSFNIVGENFTEIDFNNSCPGVTGLQDQTALSVDLVPGEQYTAELVLWTCGASQYTANANVWIDFNGDGALTNDELILLGSQTSVTGGGPTGANPTGGTTLTANFTVPASAESGLVIIRAMVQETATANLDPCASYLWGSMADFTANLTAAGQGSSDGCGPVTFSFDEDGLVTSMVLDCSNLGENTVTLYVTDAGGNVVSCESTVTVEDNIAPVIVCANAPGLVAIAENFDAGLPAGWSTVTNTGTCNWQAGNLPFAGWSFPTPAMFFNDDACGLGAPASNATLFSDIYDTTGVLSLDLSFDLAYRHLGTSSFTVEAFDGTTWQNVATYNTNQQLVSVGPFDLLAYANANFQVRFIYDDGAGWNWGVAVDNFMLEYETPVANIPQYFLDANGQVSVPISEFYSSVSDNAGACGITITVGGQGVQACSESNPANNFENGSGFNPPYVPGTQLLATDIFVDADTDFTLDNVTVNLIVAPGNPIANVSVYVFESNGAGTLPGAMIASQLNVVPTSQNIFGSAFGFDFREVSLDIDPVLLEGQSGVETSYWVAISATGTTSNQYFWETTTASVVGNGTVLSTNGGTTFQLISATTDFVYNFSGSCSSLGGGSDFIFTCADLGVVNVIVTATDASGNSTSCTTQVEIIDNIAPVLVTQDITVELDENGEASIVYQDLYGTSPDDFEVITIGGDNGSFAAGTTDLTVPVTEAAAITFDWDYSNNDLPGFDSFGYLLNGVYTQLTNPGVGNQSGTGAVAVNPGDVFGFRSDTDDNFGGAGTTVISNFMPGFQGQFAPANWTETLVNSDGSATFITIPGGVLAFDNCGISTGAVDISNFTCADIGNPVTVTVFVSDASGNIASATAVVTVVDLLGPVIECLGDTTVDTDPDSITYTLPNYIGDGLVNVTDNCTDPVTVFSQTPAPGTLLLDGTYTITLTAEDEYGNESSCSFELTVETELGIDENQLGNAIIMYPNPASSYVDLRNTSNIALTQATIYDITGKLVSSFDLTQMVGDQRLDVSNLASGVYMVYINSETASVVKRLIKK